MTVRLSSPVRFLALILGIWIAVRIIFWTPLTDFARSYSPSNFLAPMLPDFELSMLPTEPLEPMPSITSQPPEDFDWRRIEQTHSAAPPAFAGRSRTLEWPQRPSTPILATDVLATSPPVPPRRTRTSEPIPLAIHGSPVRSKSNIRHAAPHGRETLRPASPWRVSAWMLWRDAPTQPSLAREGTLGGSQTCIRIQHALTRIGGTMVGVSSRFSRPRESRRGGEAAVGLAARPSRHAPLEIMLDRRIALDSGGRNAWSLGIAGGLDRQRLPLGLELDGYAQAGVVRANSRDVYGELAMTVGRPITLSDRTTLSLGGGGFASAQPGISRLDVGPQATLRVPAGDANMRIALGWRQRVAGNADPDSGPVLLIGTDF